MKSLLSVLYMSLGGVALFTAFGTSGSRGAETTRPNIIFLFSDDQAERAVGCYGNKEIITPHLDKLARDGVRLTNHYNTTSICMASRCSVMTGLYEYRHGWEWPDLNMRNLTWIK